VTITRDDSTWLIPPFFLRRPLHLYPFSLDDFENAIKHNFEEGFCSLLVETHLACFKALNRTLNDPLSQRLEPFIEIVNWNLDRRPLTYDTWNQYAVSFAANVSTTHLIMFPKNDKYIELVARPWPSRSSTWREGTTLSDI
jgi:hypothetical protein